MIRVHKYKWSHDKKRKKYRKLLKQGKVKLINRTRDEYWYEKKSNG